MLRLSASSYFCVAVIVVTTRICAQERVAVGPADFAPVLAPAPGEARTHVAAFLLDRRPVTNAQFLDFVRSHPQWRRDRIASLFADREYLSHWAAPDQLGESALPEQPVTRVSWFAARASGQPARGVAGGLPRAHSGAIYVKVGGRSTLVREDLELMLRWLEVSL